MSETTNEVAASPATNLDAVPSATDTTTFKYRFRKDKELGTQRDPVEIVAAVPNTNGLIEIIQNDAGYAKDGKPTSKPLLLVLELMADAVRSGISDWVSGDEKASQATFDQNKYTFEAIANQPREDRRANLIPDEDWKAFAEDYIAVMPGVTNKSVDNVTNATIVFLKKFSQVKTNKPVLTLLQGQLALYMEHSKNAENFSDILELLTRKVESYLAQDDVQQLVANL
jgi:hypothetical protein